ncbi:hypothetical protein [Streptomyces tagetis]|uniref:Uncharacterized protein n=1 Tax=Streptomyces tagetis TaxID=2820809 RepID=A0A940XH38_9ACTN|nr:hypothetical protein [Streptomyces sp. RG38]MBQ0826446.1 hypothetical protein [Streptomyces sp. RG38]
MAREHKPSKPVQGRPGSRHQGAGHHGWSPDVDETRQQDNPSAHRSFHAGEHAPPKGRGRERSREEDTPVTGDRSESRSRRGERRSGRREEGMRDTGRRGRSGRPSGTKDDSAFTGVDPGPPGDEQRPG